jgi:hypothetical protein
MRRSSSSGWKAKKSEYVGLWRVGRVRRVMLLVFGD